jgi:hypothetical protein
MVYVYKEAVGRKRKAEESGAKHSLKQLKKLFARRGKGQGGSIAITSESDLDLVLTDTTFCMISAGRNKENPEDMKLSNQAIRERDEKLKSDLKESGYMYTPAIGKYGELEDSLMVMTHDADKKEMMSLGTKYHQDSVLFVSEGQSQLVYTTGEKSGQAMMEGRGYEKVPDATDYYTEIEVAKKPIRFQMLLEEIAKAIRFVWRILRKRLAV